MKDYQALVAKEGRNLFNPAYFDPAKNEIVCASELQRMAEVLHDAGCQEAWIGAESGSQRVLDAMNKGTTVSEIRIARDRLRAVGIRVGFFIQLGYMDEQLADILAAPLRSELSSL